MRTFTLELLSGTRVDNIDGVSTFVGEDQTGSFGLLAGHEPFMTSLIFGIARFRLEQQPWRYLALPGGFLYFADNRLTLSTRRYFIDTDYEAIAAQLQSALQEEAQQSAELKVSLRTMEEALLRSLKNLDDETRGSMG